jgi:hypothetical protein
MALENGVNLKIISKAIPAYIAVPCILLDTATVGLVLDIVNG